MAPNTPGPEASPAPTDKPLSRSAAFLRKAADAGALPAANSSRWALSIAGVASAIAIGLLGALIYFALPSGDDFCYGAMKFRDVGPFILHVYRQQGGRWSTTAFEGLAVAAMPNLIRSYAAILTVLLAGRFAAAYALARSVLDPSLSRARCAFVAFSFCLLYWCAMPSIGDSLFWMTGAFFYELTATAILLFLAMLWRAPLTPVRTAGLAIGAILITGAHEVAAVTLLAVMLAAAIFASRPSRRSSSLVLAATAAGVLIAILAPGNFVRAGQLSQSHGGVFHVLTLTGSLFLGRIPRWVLDPPLLLAAGVVLLDPALRLRPEWMESRRNLRLILTIAAGCCSILIGFLIAAWASDGVMPGRLLNYLYLVFLTTLFAGLLLLKPTFNSAKWPTFAAALTGGMFVAMLLAGNPRLAAQDLAQRVPQWSTAKRAALHELEELGEHPAEAAVFPRLPPHPHMYFDYEVGVDAANHPNVCIARYYGLPSITGPEPAANGADLSGRLFDGR